MTEQALPIDDATRKRKAEDANIEQPAAKFSKSKTGKVVPSVVLVDMGGASSSVNDAADAQSQHQAQESAQTQQQQQQQQQPKPAALMQPTSAPMMRREDKRVPWKLLNNRALLKKVLKANKVNQYGAAYVSIDVPTLEAELGMRFNLAPYNHLKIEAPYMRNIFGFSSKTVGTNTSHSCNLDIGDSTVDPDVIEFAQFLALVDEISLEICVKLTLESEYVQKQVDWIEDCEEVDESGKKTVNMQKLRRKVGRYFHGSLRCSSKVRGDGEKFQPVRWNEETGKYVVPNIYWFRTKIKGKKANEKLMDIAVYCDEDPPRRVFYMDEPSLIEPRKSLVKPQLELPAFNFVQKEWYCTWVTRKVLFKDAAKAVEEAEAADDCADFEGMAGQPMQTSEAELRAIAKREAEFLQQQQNIDSVTSQMTVDDDGGF